MRKKEKNKGSGLRRSIYPLSLVVMVALCAYILLPGFRELERVRAQIEQHSRVKSDKTARNDSLKGAVAGMGTSDGIERAARQYLRLAKPDEVIVVFRSPEERKKAE